MTEYDYLDRVDEADMRSEDREPDPDRCEECSAGHHVNCTDVEDDSCCCPPDQDRYYFDRGRRRYGPARRGGPDGTARP